MYYYFNKRWHSYLLGLICFKHFQEICVLLFDLQRRDFKYIKLRGRKILELFKTSFYINPHAFEQ
jgi:hypothetical protein